jgi:DNA-binding transcriptional regulator YiaG
MIPNEVELVKLVQHPMNSLLFRIRTDEEVAILAEDITRHGLKYPIEVRAEEDSSYRVVKGWTRVLACRSLGWTTIPAYVQSYTDDNHELLELVRDNTGRRQLSFKDRIVLYKHFAPYLFSQTTTLDKEKVSVLSSALLIPTNTIKSDFNKIKNGKTKDANNIQFEELRKIWQSVRPNSKLTISESDNGIVVTVQTFKKGSNNGGVIHFGPGTYSKVMKKAFEAGKSSYWIENSTGKTIVVTDALNGKKIRDIRKAFGVTQSEFARYLEISQSYLSEVEKGLSSNSHAILVKSESIAKQAGITVPRVWE